MPRFEHYNHNTMSIIDDCIGDCDDNLTPEQVFRSLVKIGDDGKASLAIHPVLAATDDCTPFVDCDNLPLTWKQLVKLVVHNSGINEGAKTAYMDIDLSDLENNPVDGYFLNTVLELDGVSIIDLATFLNSYYADVDTYAAALVIAVNTYVPFSGWTASYNAATNIFRLTAPASGAVYNGAVLTFSVRKDAFYKENEFPSVAGNTLNPSGSSNINCPNGGCFDPLNNRVLFSSFYPWDIGVYNEGGQLDVIPEFGSYTTMVVRNPVNGNFHTCEYFPPAQIRVFNSAYVHVGYQANVFRAWCGLYSAHDNGDGKTYLYFAEFNGQAVRRVDAANDVLGISSIDISAAGITQVFQMTKHPVTNNIWVVGDNGIVEIEVDNAYNVIVHNGILTGGVTVPRAVLFVNNAGTYELWITGDGVGLDIYRDTTYGFLQSINLNSVSNNPRFIMQSTYGYIFITTYTGALKQITIIDPTSRTFAFPAANLQVAGWPMVIIQSPVSNKFLVGVDIDETHGSLAIFVLDREDLVLDSVSAGGADTTVVNSDCSYVRVIL